MIATEALESRINDYYIQSERQYRRAWGLDESMALHYGFWGRGARTHAEALRDMNLEIAHRAQVKATDRVLDAGCGVGGSSIFVAKTFGCRVVGLNIVDRQLDLGRENVRRHGVADRVELIKASYLDTKLDAASFDIAFFIESSCHAPDKDVLLKEMHRVLKPGGRLVIADYFRRSGPMRADDEALLRGWEEAWVVSRFPTIDQFRTSLERAGFTEIRSSDETEQIARSARRMYHFYFLGVVIKALQRLWAGGTPMKSRNIWSAWAQEQARLRGLWRYQIVTAQKG